MSPARLHDTIAIADCHQIAGQLLSRRHTGRFPSIRKSWPGLVHTDSTRLAREHAARPGRIFRRGVMAATGVEGQTEPTGRGRSNPVRDPPRPQRRRDPGCAAPLGNIRPRRRPNSRIRDKRPSPVSSLSNLRLGQPLASNSRSWPTGWDPLPHYARYGFRTACAAAVPHRKRHSGF